MKDSNFSIVCEEPNNGKNNISSITMVILKQKRKNIVSLTFNDSNKENKVIINLSEHAWKSVSKEINELLEEGDF